MRSWKSIKAREFPRFLCAPSKYVFTESFKHHYVLFCIIPVIILAFPYAASANYLPTNTPLHHFQLSCASCHESAAVGDVQRGATGSVGKVNGDINQLCAQSGCHNYDAALNHPVGVHPVTVPANMVLDEQSRITCLTCHGSTNSSSSEVLAIAYSWQDRMLSRPEGIQFCGSCHTQMGGDLKKQSHWQFSTMAHLGSINSQFSPSAEFVRAIGGIDTESRTCLSCHTEVTATVPSDNETQQQRNIRWKNMSDHPIGMDYRRVAFRTVGGFNFPLMGNQEIRFFDGRVGCGSCHSPYVQTKNNLVISAEKGDLCRSCHNK